MLCNMQFEQEPRKLRLPRRIPQWNKLFNRLKFLVTVNFACPFRQFKSTKLSFGATRRVTVSSLDLISISLRPICSRCLSDVDFLPYE